LLLLKDGQVAASGPRDAVLAALRAKAAPPTPPPVAPSEGSMQSA
jgi:hypothetical protein